jgi:hypothetical protein
MLCPEHQRLEKENAEAGASFDSANERLRTRIGISPKEEFVSLSRAVNETWEALMHARIALDRHLREHGCENADGVVPKTETTS